MPARDSLERLHDDIVVCRRCPRLVAWREQAAREKRAAFQDWNYWGRPLPGFGDPRARVMILGLAPAAHGGNRTGRIFTGDRSGDWLFAALHRTGFARQPASTARDDGQHLTDAWVCAAVRCAPPENKPSPGERDHCLPYLEREIHLLQRVRVFVPLGAFAYAALARFLPLPRPRPRFGHGVEIPLPDGRAVLCSYHPSQRNTFTGLLTEPMLDEVLERARALGGA